jgi:fructosamine-3-kinase
LIQNLVKEIAAPCRINVIRYERVQGGDINECYCLHGRDGKYFLKLNDAAGFPAMFEMEADGLDALRNNGSMIVPEVIKYGVINDKQWLLLQWIDKGAPQKKSMENFGAALANIHHQPQTCFGWHKDNYIGSLQQINTVQNKLNAYPSPWERELKGEVNKKDQFVLHPIQHNSWTEFYTQCRIMPLVKILFDTNIFSKPDIAAASFCKKAADLFPKEAPALLHGDLWGGNYMINSNGDAVIFDPAVYCGHREMDLGMTKLFGGFSQPFYDAYHETYPLEQGWQQRLPLTQLYPLLVHAVLFGGHYIESARKIIRKFGR